MSSSFARPFVKAAAALAASALVLAGCSSDDDDNDVTTDTATDTVTSTEMSTTSMTETETMVVDPAANLVGSGCAAYAEDNPDGPGSLEGMAKSTLTEAASNNPLLTTLTSAVTGGVNPDVNLTDTLDGGEFTVFAPIDDAFGKVDDATMDALGTDADLLTSVLTHHVVSGQAAPMDVAGTHTTLAGDEVEVTGSGDDLTVDGVSVVCGGVVTENATVYLIDTVLMPEDK